MNEEHVEVLPWPPRHQGGQHVGRTSTGVLAVHVLTGIAFVSSSERSQHANRLRAVRELSLLVEQSHHVHR